MAIRGIVATPGATSDDRFEGCGILLSLEELIGRRARGALLFQRGL
jgi:hypothetical protein